MKEVDEYEANGLIQRLGNGASEEKYRALAVWTLETSMVNLALWSILVLCRMMVDGGSYNVNMVCGID